MTTATAMKFETPAPTLPYYPESRATIAAALKTHPGQWALLGQHPQSGSARQIAYSVRRGLSGWEMFGPGFEAEARTLFGEHRIYVRYTGPAS